MRELGKTFTPVTREYSENFGLESAILECLEECKTVGIVCREKAVIVSRRELMKCVMGKLGIKEDDVRKKLTYSCTAFTKAIRNFMIRNNYLYVVTVYGCRRSSGRMGSYYGKYYFINSLQHAYEIFQIHQQASKIVLVHDNELQLLYVKMYGNNGKSK